MSNNLTIFGTDYTDIKAKSTGNNMLIYVDTFLNTSMSGYTNLTSKVYVPSAFIESYKTATNWKTLYDVDTVEFLAIEGSDYER